MKSTKAFSALKSDGVLYKISYKIIVIQYIKYFKRYVKLIWPRITWKPVFVANILLLKYLLVLKPDVCTVAPSILSRFVCKILLKGSTRSVLWILICITSLGQIIC